MSEAVAETDTDEPETVALADGAVIETVGAVVSGEGTEDPPPEDDPPLSPPDVLTPSISGASTICFSSSGTFFNFLLANCEARSPPPDVDF